MTIGAAALLAVTACTSSGSTPGSASSTPSGPATDSAQDAGPIVPADSTLQWHSCAGLLAELAAQLRLLDVRH